MALFHSPRSFFNHSPCYPNLSNPSSIISLSADDQAYYYFKEQRSHLTGTPSTSCHSTCHTLNLHTYSVPHFLLSLPPTKCSGLHPLNSQVSIYQLLSAYINSLSCPMSTSVTCQLLVSPFCSQRNPETNSLIFLLNLLLICSLHEHPYCQLLLLSSIFYNQDLGFLLNIRIHFPCCSIPIHYSYSKPLLS